MGERHAERLRRDILTSGGPGAFDAIPVDPRPVTIKDRPECSGVLSRRADKRSVRRVLMHASNYPIATRLFTRPNRSPAASECCFRRRATLWDGSYDRPARQTTTRRPATPPSAPGRAGLPLSRKTRPVKCRSRILGNNDGSRLLVRLVADVLTRLLSPTRMSQILGDVGYAASGRRLLLSIG